MTYLVNWLLLVLQWQPIDPTEKHLPILVLCLFISHLIEGYASPLTPLRNQLVASPARDTWSGTQEDTRDTGVSEECQGQRDTRMDAWPCLINMWWITDRFIATPISLWHNKSRATHLPSIWYCKMYCLDQVIPLDPMLNLTMLNCVEDNHGGNR